MEFRRYLAILRRRWLLVLCTVAVGVGATYIATPRSTIYDAQSIVVVGPRQYDTNPNSGDLSLDRAAGIERLTFTYAVMVKSLPVVTDAVEKTGVARSPQAVLGHTVALPVPNTQLLQIGVSDSDPAVAQALADGMADAFVSRVTSFSANQPAGVGTLPEIPVYVFEHATLPTTPRPTDLTNNMLIGALFGFLAAAGLITLLEYLDITLKSVEDAERSLGLPVLGGIPVVDNLDSAVSAQQGRPTRPTAELQSA